MCAITIAIPIGYRLDFEESSRRANGIEWIEGIRLANLDFADDITLLASSWEGMIGMTGRVEEAAKVGLRINADKSKLMTIGNCDTSQFISTGNKVIAEVDEFC